MNTPNETRYAHLDPRRNGRITGSRVGAILGLNPYQSRDDTLRLMVRENFGAEPEFKGNEATRYGQDNEARAISLYGEPSHGGGILVIHPDHDFLAVTPDGLIGDSGMIEVKCPYRGTYTHWQEKPYYEAQIRLQLACTGRSWCDFVVLHRDGNLHVSRLQHDGRWLTTMLPSLEAFMADYHAAIKTLA